MSLVSGQFFSIFLSLCLPVSVFLCLLHTLFLYFFFSSPSFFPPVSLSPQSAFLQQAVGFAFATSILRVTAVVAHKAGTLDCDVARCPMAALHNTGWRLGWPGWPVFTQAPRACCDPTAAALRGRLAVLYVTHRRGRGEGLALQAKQRSSHIFHSWSVRRYDKSNNVRYPNIGT